MKAISQLVLTGAAGVLMASCTTSPSTLNREAVIGAGGRDAYRPPTLTPAFGRAAALRQGDTEAAVADPLPSATTIDRGHWEVVRVAVPDDASSHRPLFTRNVFADDTLDRNRGSYPTALSASQTVHPDGNDRQLLEAVKAPVAALVDVVLFLPRAALTRPWQATRNGQEPYRRAPLPRGSISPALTATAPALRGGKPDPDSAAAPVQVPIGEYHPVPEQAPGVLPREPR